jgi:hypothetical protein
MFFFSIAGHRLLNCPGIGAYCATKHAVTVISEALRMELRDLGTRIRVTVSFYDIYVRLYNLFFFYTFEISVTLKNRN